MNEKKYKWLLYLIVTTILLTIVVQCYWNYKNYQQNKLNFINQVQTSLDNALDTYYADLAESNEMTILESLDNNEGHHNINSDSIIEKIRLNYHVESEKEIEGFTQFNENDSGYTFKNGEKHLTQIKVFRGKKASDSIKYIEGIKSIFISIHNDTLEFEKLNPILKNELNRKQLNIPYALNHYRSDSVLNAFNTTIDTVRFLKTNSKSTFLKQDERLEIKYPNATKIILTRSLSSVLISIVLILVVISCLFYLLKIIKHQKQLAEVKNDLISNITHEFKTPIATIGVALESIKDFKVIDDKEKTKQYLNMSSDQLSKLNMMVEKLLETATLDSDNLELNKDDINLIDLINKVVGNQQVQDSAKTINFDSFIYNLIVHADVFHLENVINNVIDNALKYGGEIISIQIEENKGRIDISVSDTGNALTKQHKEKIFEQFYRVPKGNTHNVKGFGIGLYYTKKIIEKHGGTIQLELGKKRTTFKISLPNE